MIKAFIIIRIKQIYRLLLELGIFRIVFLLGLFSFLGFMLFMFTANSEKPYLASVVASFIFASIQYKRKDKLFLKTHFAHYKLINWVEYALASIPLVICLIYHAHWFSLALLLLLIALSVQVDYEFKSRSINSIFQKYIPSESFEWKAGIRKLLFLFVPLWILSLLTSFFIGSVPLAIFVFGIALIGFNETCEPYQMILAFEKDADQFLRLKLKRQFSQFSVLVLPLMLSFVIFHYEYWYIVVAEYVIFILLHAYFLLTKYALYEPNEKPPGTQIYSTLGTLAILIPLFIPVVALLSVHFYYKSIDNLNFYLDDYN